MQIYTKLTDLHDKMNTSRPLSKYEPTFLFITKYKSSIKKV